MATRTEIGFMLCAEFEGKKGYWDRDNFSLDSKAAKFYATKAELEKLIIFLQTQSMALKGRTDITYSIEPHSREVTEYVITGKDKSGRQFNPIHTLTPRCYNIWRGNVWEILANGKRKHVYSVTN